ncbi:MAG: T9SS type A sorting domain-containing protein [Flavobacteriales bacterium]|nr:T9SS type A sorting domain-containing protein [Flavobacteriales bacterium]
MRNNILLVLTCFLALPTSAQVNDLCSGITPDALTVGASLVWTGDNTGATYTGDFVVGSVLDGFQNPAVWHAFTTTECADITVDYCGTVPAFGEFWNILATTCPAGNAFIPSQQTSTTACGDGNPTSYFVNIPAGTYYYPIWTETGVAEGPYTINVTASVCGGGSAVNDECGSVTAEALTLGGSLTLSGDVTFATSTGDFVTGSPYAGAPVVWHAFTTTECADVSLSYCGLDPVWTNSFGFFARDCPASDLVLFSSFNSTDCLDGNRTYLFDQLAAGTYYVPVLLDPNDNAVGPYELTLSASACPAVPTFFDLCSQVQYQPLAVGASLTLSGDNTAATGTNDFDPGSPFSGAPVVWHGITTTSCSNITLAYCGLDPTWDNTFGFFATECPMVTPYYFTTFNNDDCVDGNRTYVFNNVPAGSYLIPVLLDAVNNAIGPYSLQVSAAACAVVPPANDDCTNVIAEALAVGTTLTFTGDNTNATSAGDFVVGSPFIAAPVVWHSFTTGECSDVLLKYCGQDPVWSNTFGFLATTCPGDALVYFSTTNSTGCVEGNTTYLFNDLPAGTYYVPVLSDAANNSFGSYSIDVVAENCLFLAMDARAPEPLTVWPNPSNGHLFIDHLPAGSMMVQVMDATGRTVHTQRTPAATGGRTELALEGRLAPGTYLLVLTSERHRLEQRFVVR